MVAGFVGGLSPVGGSSGLQTRRKAVRRVCRIGMTAAGAWSYGGFNAPAEKSASEKVESEVLRMKIAGCDVYMPEDEGQVRALIHFIPGAVVSAAPGAFYGNFLAKLSAMGYAIIATPYYTTFDHMALGTELVDKFGEAFSAVQPRLPTNWMPMFGMGHSLGAKMHVLINSDAKLRRLLTPRASNILLSYNNFDAAESLPKYETMVQGLNMLDKLSPFLNELGLDARSVDVGGVPASELLRQMENFRGDINPPKREFDTMLQNEYGVDENLVVSFNNDTIDQSDILEATLRVRYGKNRTLRRMLPGSHLTPMTPAFGDVARSIGFGPEIDQLLQSRVGQAREKYQDEVETLVKTVTAYLLLRTQDIETKLLGPGR